MATSKVLRIGTKMITIDIRPEPKRSRITKIMLYHDVLNDDKLRVFVARDSELACDGNVYTDISKASASRLTSLTHKSQYDITAVIGSQITIFIRLKGS